MHNILPFPTSHFKGSNKIIVTHIFLHNAMAYAYSYKYNSCSLFRKGLPCSKDESSVNEDIEMGAWAY